MNLKLQFVTYVLVTALVIETVHIIESTDFHDHEETQLTLTPPTSGSANLG